MKNLLVLAANSGAGAGAGGSLSFLFIIILMFVVMYFTMIRPGKKQQKARQEMLGNMKKGDHITTIGGLHGVIDTINDAEGTIVIDADGILLTFSRTAIRNVKPAATKAAEDTTESTEDTDQDATIDAPKADPDSTADDDKTEAKPDDQSDETENK